MEEEKDLTKHHIEFLVRIIDSLSASQKQLTQSACDFQNLVLAKKNQKEDAVDRADDLGEVLDIYITLLKDVSKQWGKEC